MHITIDGAGRVVIPKAIRERAGLYAGVQIGISVDDDGIRLIPQIPPPRLVRRGRLLLVVGPEQTEAVNDETVESIRGDLAAERMLRAWPEPGV